MHDKAYYRKEQAQSACIGPRHPAFCGAREGRQLKSAVGVVTDLVLCRPLALDQQPFKFFNQRGAVDSFM
jgi:hypothetical protein